MDLRSFKLDIDNLIEEFVQNESTTLAEFKNLWSSRKFSCIYEASPSTNLSLFMQSLYAHCIGHLTSNASSSRRLGGLYVLYCLYETQPFKPPFKVYVSLGDLQKLRCLVSEAKGRGVRLVPALVKRMLEKNMFLFGFVDLSYGNVTEICHRVMEVQNARVRVASEKLFDKSQLDEFLGMDLGEEIDLGMLKQMSAEYEEAEKCAIGEDGKESLADGMEQTVIKWDAEKELFEQETGKEQEETEQLLYQPSEDAPLVREQGDEEQNGDAFDEFYQLLLESE